MMVAQQRGHSGDTPSASLGTNPAVPAFRVPDKRQAGLDGDLAVTALVESCNCAGG